MLANADVPASLWFADEDDMLRLEGKLDRGNGNGVWPRTDKQGKPLHDWRHYLQLGMNELARRIRSMKSTAEPAELGRFDTRSKAKLRDPAAAFALHYLFMDADQPGEPWFSERASYWWRMGGDWLDAESSQLDYDIDHSGTTDEIEKNQPFVQRVIRG